MDYHRGNPAPGVRVDPVPMPKTHISQAQRRLARTPLTNHKGEYIGVFKAQMIGGPVGLGMMSTVSTLRSPVVATHGFGVRPGYRRRGHCTMGSNTCFAMRIPHKRTYLRIAMDKGLAQLRGMHLRLHTTRGDTRNMEERYEHMREQFLGAYPEAGPELVRIESSHRSSIR